MTLLDKQIEKDLTELYLGKAMSGAEKLNKIGVVTGTTFSTRGLPLHFVGDRKAKTVFVMLNPGEEACIADYMFSALTASYNRTSARTFIDSYINEKTKVHVNRTVHVNSFDVKQAAFLKPWIGCGVTFPPLFPICPCTYWDAVENCLNQKLQLEFIPYSSKTFGNIDSSNMKDVVPFLEILFDEISFVKREYVIFGSGKFADLFDWYNGFCKDNGILNHVVLSKTRERCPLKTRDAYCSKIKVNYNGKSFDAIIAHTFSNQAYSKAYSFMEKYGKFCYDEHKKLP